jgi:hypothetical protein
LLPAVSCALRYDRGHPVLLRLVRASLAAVNEGPGNTSPTSSSEATRQVTHLVCQELLQLLSTTADSATALATVIGA